MREAPGGRKRPPVTGDSPPIKHASGAYDVRAAARTLFAAPRDAGGGGAAAAASAVVGEGRIHNWFILIRDCSAILNAIVE
jgi:hypothetical protein